MTRVDERQREGNEHKRIGELGKERASFPSRYRSGSESNFRNCDETPVAEDGHSAKAVTAIPFIDVCLAGNRATN